MILANTSKRGARSVPSVLWLEIAREHFRLRDLQVRKRA
jgi:hypothetical protein